MPTCPTSSGSLHYVLDGPSDAPVLVLSNSLGTTLSMWERQLPLLTSHFRVLRYDQRGHGRSSAPPGPYTVAELGGDVLELLDGLGVARASFVGLSFGGMVGMWLGAHAPERVERLVLCCTAAVLPPAQLWTDRAAAVRAKGTEPLYPGLLERWFTPGFPEAEPQVAALIHEMLASCDAEGYAACCEAIGAFDASGDLARITAPTLVIGGREDPVAPVAAVSALSSGIAGAGLSVLSGAAHLANIEQPAAFSAALRGHLVGAMHDAGMGVRREVLSPGYVDAAKSRVTPLSAGFQDLITRYAWGEIWTRPGLDRKTRSCITLTALVTGGHLEELVLHVRAARRNGLSVEEIGEVLLQCAIYAGVPAANSAFAVANRVLAEDGEFTNAGLSPERQGD
jgi:3-oxoadipate enol-lactonase/4-carboxymuconolactone decarboxylase